MNALSQIGPTDTLPTLISRATVSGAGVYFLQDDLGRVKIGVTKDIAARKAAVQTGSGSDLHLIRFIAGAGPKVEKWLHRRFKDLHIRGEWYAFFGDMLTVTPPDEVPSRVTVVQRRDIGLTLRERIRSIEESADLMGLSHKERLMMIVQQTTDDEAGEVCEAIRAFIKARVQAGAA